METSPQSARRREDRRDRSLLYWIRHKTAFKAENGPAKPARFL